MKTPILGSAYVARSVNAADARMVNLFPEIVPEGGKEPAFLNRCPGLKFENAVGSGPIRGLWVSRTYPDNFYVASGNEFYKLTSLNGTPVKLGNIGGEGPVSIADNGTQLFIACGSDGYIYNQSTNTFAQITDPDFPGATTVTYLNGYFVFNEPSSQKIWITSLFDGSSIDPLEFASAEASPDGVVGIISDHKELWIFGTDTTEMWYDAGNVDFPFAPIQGAFNEIGCASPWSVAKLDNSLFWLGTDPRGKGIVYRADGYRGVRVSTHAVEWQIQQYSTIDDAVAYTYQQDGHGFYVLNFPTANRTWVFDVATQAWHERAAWENNEFTRHRGNNQCNYQGNTVIGDYQTGNIYTYDLDIYSDNNQIQRWLRSWRALPTGQNNLKRSAQHTLQLDVESGVGLNGIFDENGTFNSAVAGIAVAGLAIAGMSGQGSESAIPPFGVVPKVMLRWSDDGGHTWSNEHWVSIGKIGQYGKRAIWRRLGMTEKIRDRVYEVSGTDPVKLIILGAELSVSPTNA